MIPRVVRFSPWLSYSLALKRPGVPILVQAVEVDHKLTTSLTGRKSTIRALPSWGSEERGFGRIK